MSTYCISDIHGCYNEFMALIDKIKFISGVDKIYILGDVIDRGPRPIDCLKYIRDTENIYFIRGNHEQMMLDYYSGKDQLTWTYNGYIATKSDLDRIPKVEVLDLFSYLNECPYYYTISMNGREYLLSHAGINNKAPLQEQLVEDLIWGDKSFYRTKALGNYIYIFGHVVTVRLYNDYNCSIWYDSKFKDKIGIDCGCVYGGALSALRLEDGATFYVKSTLSSSSFAMSNSQINYNHIPII